MKNVLDLDLVRHERFVISITNISNWKLQVCDKECRPHLKQKLIDPRMQLFCYKHRKPVIKGTRVCSETTNTKEI